MVKCSYENVVVTRRQVVGCSFVSVWRIYTGTNACLLREDKKKYMNDLITNTTKEANDLHRSYRTTATTNGNQTYHLVVGVNRCRCPREGLGPRGVGSGH